MTTLALMATAPATASPGDVFKEWIGKCFEAKTPQGMPDRHCFTAAADGRLVMDIHKVRDDEGHVVYEGVTVYTPGEGGKTAFAYSNSLGQVMPGDVSRTADNLDFNITIGSAGQSLTWRWTGDGYDVISGATTARFTQAGQANNGL